jgi:hypothetical protein
MSAQYTVRSETVATPSVRALLSLRRAGAACVVGAVIAAVGSTVTAVIHTSISADKLSFPFSPSAFRFTEVLWAVTHLLTFFGALGMVRSNLIGTSRLSTVGARITLVAMALLVPCELAFIFAAGAAEDSTQSTVMGSAIGFAATAAGIGFVLVGIATLRTGLWAGWGRFTPLLCGVFVVAVLVPVQAIRPSIFLWPIAGWNVCLALLGVALVVVGRDHE